MFNAILFMRPGSRTINKTESGIMSHSVKVRVWMGGGGRGRGCWKSLINKNLAHYSLSLKYLLIL